MTTGRVDERYALDREIGRGASGPVWLGRDEVLGRPVAIKRVGTPVAGADPDALRAEREARLAAAVNHPHVVAVFDLVEADDAHWLVMEYVEGGDLAARIREHGALSPDEAAPLLLQVAEALAAAHQAGIVHRDVKPSNMLIDATGTVKLTDFGIARAVADASLTQTGLVTGSPAYLSPEVASGSVATPASDVWSFGATLFHTLAGSPPYDIGDNLMGAMYRIVHEDPPRLEDAGWMAPLLDATMAKDPAHRPSMDDVVAFLDHHVREAAELHGPPVPVAHPVPDGECTQTLFDATEAFPAPAPLPPASGRRRAQSERRPVAVLAGVGAVVLLLALIGGLLLFGGGDDRPAAQGRDDSSRSTEAPPSSTATSAAPTPPTPEEMEEFARTYVDVASSDPDAGFAYLTKEYQASSPQYREFWGSVSNPRIAEVEADAEAMSVTYTYSYSLRGAGRRTETITLNLVQQGEDLLIASAATVG